MMRSQDDTCIVMKGGRKFRRLPMHVSMHIENESSGETCLRYVISLINNTCPILTRFYSHRKLALY